MLTDHWVITQLLSQLCSIVLLMGACYFAGTIVRFWNVQAGNELQLSLERKTYLVSSIVQFVLIFQVIALVTFLLTTNHHLPNVIKGAMCAKGALEVNEYGYPLLYLKMGGVLLYATYLIFHYLDESEPAYPLTPFKYWFVFPSLILVIADFVLMVLYFAEIEPDIIATCCSVAFIGWRKNSGFELFTPQNTVIPISLFIGSYIVLLLGNWKLKKAIWVNLLIAGVFVFSGIISLKYYFVKYIYGLPSHLCIFDIFFPQYNYIGFLIFGIYYLLLVCIIGKTIIVYSRSSLKINHAKLLNKLDNVIYVSATLSVSIPIMYWLIWDGVL